MKKQIETYFPFYSSLISPNIIKNLGKSIFLLLWCFDKVTYIENGVGFVLGGRPMTYSYIGKNLGVHQNTIKNWGDKLFESGFIFKKKVYGSRLMWFTMGYDKKINKQKTSERYSKRITEVLQQQKYRDNNKILNPLWNYMEFQPSSSQQNSDPNTTKNCDAKTRSCGSITYISDDKKDDKDINKYSVVQKNKIPSVRKVFRLYIEKMGSKRTDPTDEEATLIKNALDIEGEEIIKETIKNYFEKVEENRKWRPYTPQKFFHPDFYVQFIRDPSEYKFSEKSYNPTRGWDS